MNSENSSQNNKENTQISKNEQLKKELSNSIENRGFYLYEWINTNELKWSIEVDFFNLMNTLTKPAFWISAIAGIVGYFFAEIPWILIAVGWFLGAFYIFVVLIIIFLSLRKWYIYSKFGSIAITDSHIVAGEKILKHNNFEERRLHFATAEKMFHEPFLQESILPKIIEEQKDGVRYEFGNIGTKIAYVLSIPEKRSNNQYSIFETSWAGNVFDNRKKYDKNIINISIWLVWFVLIASFILFSIAFGIMYFLLLPVVYIIGKIFAKFFHKILLIKNNTEFKVQAIFSEIDTLSSDLELEKDKSVFWLNEAKNNNWQENLGNKIHQSINQVNTHALQVYEKSKKLRKILENSKYKEIFNFKKYDNWIREQILEPIEEILQLLEQNRNILIKNIADLEQKSYKKPGDNFWWASFTSTMQAQKTRLEIQLENTSQMMLMLEWYKNKLQ